MQPTHSLPAAQPCPPAPAATGAAAPAPTLAVRKSCNPDGIGLSHYVLMDRKAAK